MFWFSNCNVLFCTAFMRRNQRAYSIFQLSSAIFMILALLWLTISTPFVYADQQQQAKSKVVNTSSSENGEEEAGNPFSNTTEEKNPNNNSLSEEYLHHDHLEEYFFSIALQYHKCENADTYIAYHGELLVPPPDRA